MAVDQGPPPYEVLAALVVSLQQELTDARAELAQARERIAELEVRLRQTLRTLRSRRRARADQAGAAVAAEEKRP